MADAAFDRVDELCATGPVVLWADDAQFLDAATLSLLRRLGLEGQPQPAAGGADHHPPGSVP